MNKVCVVADVGSNWKHGPEEGLKAGKQRWLDLIRTCADCGVDAVKGQFLRRTVYPEGSAEARLVADYEWPAEWLPFLQEQCFAAGVEWLCTVFEPQHVPIMNPYVHRWKIASFESLREDLRLACWRTEKRLIVSTGTLTDKEVGGLLRHLGGRDTLLYCVSKYPADVGDYDLVTLREWVLPCQRGLSDHTHPAFGSVVAVGAVACGATTVETHVTLTRQQTSPDAHFARKPDELRAYVRDIRLAEQAVGDGLKSPRPGEVVEYRYDERRGTRGVMRHGG